MALGTSSMTLLELTAAYAGVAGNDFPVIPHAFAMPEEGWFGSLVNGRSSLSGRDHKYLEQLLRAAINRGTGKAAALSVPNFGKTGTTQDNRDALFVGYAGGLVVGVWIGNDDNSPLSGVSGGGAPARIWRAFMQNALALGRSSPRPDTRPSGNPRGPVEPLDVPEIDDIPVGENGPTIRMRDGEPVVIFGEIEGVPVDVQIDDGGVRVNAGDQAVQNRR